MHRRVVAVLLVAACRLHFDDRPPDAAPPDGVPDTPPVSATCNTPVRLADATTATEVFAVGMPTVIVAGFIDTTTAGYGVVLQLGVPGEVELTLGPQLVDTGFDAGAVASSGNTVVTSFVQNGTTQVQINDQNLNIVAGPTPITGSIGGPRAVAMTNNTTGPIAAVTTIDASGQVFIVGVNGDASLGTPVGLGSAGSGISESSLANVGDRIAIVNATTMNNCFVRTIDLGITTTSATTGWGTANECTQPQLGYSPGRSDALLVRHDLTDGDLNHVVATRTALTYSIPGESRLRTPGNEPRPVGVADGYWVAYETGGALEAAHVDFTGTIGTVVPLGPIAATTTYDTAVADGEPYVIWVQDGLRLVHLCP